MKVNLFVTKNEQDNTYKFLKSLDLPFVPERESFYIDEENRNLYIVNRIVFKDNKIAVILVLRNDGHALLNSMSGLIGS